MSANRSVQAAQRRRAGPPEPQAPGRGGPQPSINSAQMFANQARSGPGPNLPPGRIAAQQMNMQQDPNYGQGYNGGVANGGGGVASVNKMTIPQAITLVTLRLGALETKMINLEIQLPQMLAGDHTNGVDFSENGIIQSLMERVDNIEKSIENNDNPNTNTATNPAELTAIKTQLDTIKQSIIQFKGISATLANDNKGLKSQIEKLRQELGEYKQLLTALQSTSLEHSQKILEFELSIVPNNGIPLDQLEEEYTEEGEGEGDDDNDIQSAFSLTNTNTINDASLSLPSQQELLGINLKEAIELELNS